MENVENGKFRPLKDASTIPTPQGQQIYKYLGDLETRIVGIERGDQRIKGWYDKASKMARVTVLNPMLQLTSEALGLYCMEFTDKDYNAKLYHCNMLKAKYFEIQAKLNLLERMGGVSRTEAQNAAESIMTPLVKMINAETKRVIDKMRQPR